MLRSLRLRLVVFLLVPVVVAGALALGLTTRSVTSYERAQTQQRLQDQGPGVVRQFAEAARRAFRLGPAFLAAGAAALLLALVVGFRITAPLRRLAAASSAIAGGNYRVRLDGRRRGCTSRTSSRASCSCRAMSSKARFSFPIS